MYSIYSEWAMIVGQWLVVRFSGKARDWPLLWSPLIDSGAYKISVQWLIIALTSR